MGTEPNPSSDLIRAQLNTILRSKLFRSSELQKQFLGFVVARTLEGKAAEIKEYVVGTEAFGRGPDFDPRIDSVVRVVARRVRERLAEFYRHEGRHNSLIIEVPPGSYIPTFSFRRQLVSSASNSPTSSPPSQSSTLSPSPGSIHDLVGTTVSHYELLELIAKGSSGLVFRAEDLRLKRGVALKVLYPRFTSVSQQLERLMQEARFASAVNHPNICAVYDIGEFQGTAFIAMELVQGKTLERFIDHKPLATETLLDLGIQISDALTAAHSRGVAHRDVRSANIMVNGRGDVKLLDFSAARALKRESPVREPETYANEGKAAAQDAAAKIELAEGAEAAAVSYDLERADILGMGAILYEMATGEHYRTASDPPPGLLNPALPAEVDSLIRSALLGEPSLASVSAIRDKLMESQQAFDRERLSASISTVNLRTFLRSKWTIVSLALVVAVFLALYFAIRPTTPAKILAFKQLTHDGQGKLHSFAFGVPTPLVSDGSRLYLQEMYGAKTLIAQVSIQGGETVPLQTEWKEPQIVMDLSPDRSELLVRDFFGSSPERTISKMSLLDGTPRPVGHMSGHDAAWSPEGNRICYANDNELYLANSDGSESKRIASLPGPASWPRWSPDGKLIRFTVQDTNGRTSLWEVAPDAPNPHVLFSRPDHSSSECCGSWSPDGKHFVFQLTQNGGTSLWEVREQHSLFGTSISEATRLTDGPLNVSAPLFSTDGHRIYAVVQQRRGELVRYDANLRTFQLYLGGISADHVEFSRDSRWIAYASFPEGTIWRSRPDGSERLQLSSAPISALFPRWSPDGQRIAFMGSRSGSAVKIYLVQSKGSEPERLMPDDSPEIDPNWSPDGNSIMFAKLPSVNDTDKGSPLIQILDLKSRRITTLPGSEGLTAPRWSPDGRFVAAVALSGGKWGNPAALLFDFTTGKWTPLEDDPIDNKWWSQDGKYFYFDKYMDNDPAIYRLRLSDLSIERVAGMSAVRRSFSDMGWWMGIAPDGSPMVLRDTSIEEIYALDFSSR
jgi:eukaryotic-like serine/threonine-protein kinase